MGRGAVVLLITDGLDRDPQAGLEHEMRRLHLSSRRLIWLNPLLRWDEFSAKATGIRTMLPHVDCFSGQSLHIFFRRFGGSDFQARGCGRKAASAAHDGCHLR